MHKAVCTVLVLAMLRYGVVEGDTDPVTSTTLRPLSERQCVPGFECNHGFCDNAGASFSCVCDIGWNGVFCDTFQCPLNCLAGSDCVLVNGDFECNEKVLPTTTTSSIPTTTLRPLSERQCVPGFQCIHGLCDTNGGSFSCLCDPGWDGPFCDTFQCPLNCLAGSDCVLVNGDFECNEKVLPTTTTSSIPTTTLRPLSERQCVPGFECVHGFCDIDGGSFSCSCDDGWEGVFCHQFICLLDCPSNTDCALVGDMFICKPKDAPTTPSVDKSSTLQPTHNSTNNSTAVHACATNYTKRPLSERQCMPNFVCEYGVCEMSEGDIGTILECVCDDGGLGGLCQDKCCMPCSEYGQCKTLANGTEYCQCQFNYEGTLCDSKKVPITPGPGTTEMVLWPLWVSAIVLVCLIVAAVILFFWMWRNRVTIVMKIVHYFQAYEDDDEKLWDAFVSYKSSDVDQHFVQHTLFPKLEKELGFTLCLHHRDFMPGETIANNIIQAIDNSRRTILVLTPRYVSSEFTRFEYQVAQHEMMKRKHKIIPILLEDISGENDSMDPNLKQIIKSVTYLEYPGADSSEKKMNHFWKKLILSLPKKRATEERLKQEKGVVDDKEKKTIDIDKYNDIEGKPGKNGLCNPAFITDLVVTVVDEQNAEKNESELIPPGSNVIEWTHL